MNGAWLFLKKRTHYMVLCGLALGGLFFFVDYQLDKAREGRTAAQTRQEIVEGVENVKVRIDELDKKVTHEQEVNRAILELQTCLFVVHFPEQDIKAIFPGADVEKCKQKLRQFNNSDGTFLPREIDGTGTSQNVSPSPLASPSPSPNTPCTLVIQNTCIVPGRVL